MIQLQHVHITAVCSCARMNRVSAACIVKMSQQRNTLFLPILIPHLQFLNKIIAGFNIFILQGSDGCKNCLVFNIENVLWEAHLCQVRVRITRAELGANSIVPCSLIITCYLKEMTSL
jgi:hypothetical protein